jgi:hypothetical protein
MRSPGEPLLPLRVDHLTRGEGHTVQVFDFAGGKGDPEAQSAA